MSIATGLAGLHRTVFGGLERATDGWLLGLAGRFVFASVLLTYYLNSFRTKVGEGFSGFFQVQDSAYFQIVPSVVESAGYDTSAVSFIPYGLIVLAGTYTEMLLPILIVLGLFTRIAALGMIGFVFVQSFVDIAFHGVGEETTGHMFDRFPDAAIFDQRLLWVFLLVVLVIKGPGSISIDHHLAGGHRKD